MSSASKEGWHRHSWETNDDGTARVCKTCGAMQVKRQGRWTVVLAVAA